MTYLALRVFDLICKQRYITQTSIFVKSKHLLFSNIHFHFKDSGPKYKCKANRSLPCSVNEISNFPHSQQPVRQMQQLKLKSSATRADTETSHTPFDTEAVGSDGSPDARSGWGPGFVRTGVTHQHLAGTAPALQIRGYEL